MSNILETVKTASVRLVCGTLTVNGHPAQFTVSDLAKAEAEREIIRRDYGGITWWEERPRDYGASSVPFAAKFPSYKKYVKRPGIGKGGGKRANRTQLPMGFVMAMSKQGASGAQIAKALAERGIVVSRDLVNVRIKEYLNESR